MCAIWGGGVRGMMWELSQQTRENKWKNCAREEWDEPSHICSKEWDEDESFWMSKGKKIIQRKFCLNFQRNSSSEKESN